MIVAWQTAFWASALAKQTKKSIASGSGTAADPIAPASNIEAVALEESMAAETVPDRDSILPCPEHGPEAVPRPKKRQRTLTGPIKVHPEAAPMQPRRRYRRKAKSAKSFDALQ